MMIPLKNVYNICAFIIEVTRLYLVDVYQVHCGMNLLGQDVNNDQSNEQTSHKSRTFVDRVYEACAKNGPLSIKILQMLSVFLPENYRGDNLMRILDDTSQISSSLHASFDTAYSSIASLLSDLVLSLNGSAIFNNTLDETNISELKRIGGGSIADVFRLVVRCPHIAVVDVTENVEESLYTWLCDDYSEFNDVERTEESSNNHIKTTSQSHQNNIQDDARTLSKEGCFNSEESEKINELTQSCTKPTQNINTFDTKTEHCKKDQGGTTLEDVAKNISEHVFALKVFHPGVRAMMNSELCMIKRILECAELISSEASRMNLHGIVTMMQDTLLEQCTPRLEYEYASGMHAAHRNLSPSIIIPKTYLHAQKDGAEIVAYEFFEGTPLSAYEADDLDVDECIDIVVRMYTFLLNSLFTDGVVHSDLHPGNIMRNAQGQLAIIDFGMCQKLSYEMRRNLILLFVYLLTGDEEHLTSTMRDICFPEGNMSQDRERVLARTTENLKNSYDFVPSMIEMMQRIHSIDSRRVVLLMTSFMGTIRHLNVDMSVRDILRRVDLPFLVGGVARFAVTSEPLS